MHFQNLWVFVTFHHGELEPHGMDKVMPNKKGIVNFTLTGGKTPYKN